MFKKDSIEIKEVTSLRKLHLGNLNLYLHVIQSNILATCYRILTNFSNEDIKSDFNTLANHYLLGIKIQKSVHFPTVASQMFREATRSYKRH